MNGLKNEVNDVTEIMMENYSKVKEREGKLSDLEERAEDLKEKGKVFEKTTTILMEQKKEEYEGKKCTRNKKLIFAVIAVGLGIIIGAALAAGLWR